MAWVDDIFKRTAEQVIKLPERSWNAANIMRAMPRGAVPFGNVIPLGQAPLGGQGLSDLFAQAVRMANQSVGQGFAEVAPTVPQAPEDMTEEEYLRFYDIYQQAQRDALLRSMMQYAQTAAQQAVEGELGGTLMREAEKTATTKPDVYGVFEAARKPIDVKYSQAKQNLGYNLAKTGGRNTSTGQIAAGALNMQYGGELANAYLDSLAKAYGLKAQEVQAMMMPETTRAALQKAYIDAITRLVLGANPSVSFMVQ